ncbi:hypothetical protein BCF55_1712 [Hydrogenivirga caldilitoris]|uniref:Uncharacterized protein n=1 Tax=Hydrogenivirga caldilitoris TaxID=246264 RepID=A0A497XTB8_9AQUI|nr:hypothetical protein [Hydrogenivirga caldilitoris]RLJ71410.1 hypothetical protein BCF55_1712 [Hydrogenivirga caldilitoris]
MDKVFYEIGKHFLSVGLAVIVFIPPKNGGGWVLHMVVSYTRAILIFMGGRKDGS